METDTGHRGLAGHVRDLFQIETSRASLRPSRSNVAGNAIGIELNSQNYITHNVPSPNLNNDASSESTVPTIILGRRARKNDAQSIRILSALFFIFQTILIFSLYFHRFVNLLHPYLFICLFILVGPTIIYYLLYRMWCQIPDKFNRMHPFVRIFFLMIPLLNIVWVFICYRDLAVALNKCSKAWHISCRVSESFVTFVCCLCAMSKLGSLLGSFCSKIHLYRLSNFIRSVSVTMEHLQLPFIIEILWLLMFLTLTKSILALTRASQY